MTQTPWPPPLPPSKPWPPPAHSVFFPGFAIVFACAVLFAFIGYGLGVAMFHDACIKDHRDVHLCRATEKKIWGIEW